VSQQPSLSISLVTPAAPESGPLLLLEQEEWQPCTGYMSTANMVRAVAAQLYPDAWSVEVDCGLTNGMVVSRIFAYPIVSPLDYTVLSSHGEIGTGRLEQVLMDEIVQFRLDTSHSVNYPVTALDLLDWLCAYDAAGNPLAGPAVTLSGREVSAAEPIYGSLRVRYLTTRTTFTLRMDAREDAAEHFWSAIILGLPVGGEPVLLAFDPPPALEEMTAAGDECGDSTGETKDQNNMPIPEVSPGNRTEIYDYCSGELLRVQ
jgi:hypothetical protein